MKTIDEVLEQVYLVVQPEDGRRGDINIWLVNETDEDIEYRVRTGEFTSLDDGVLESAVAGRDARTIPARSALVFEQDDVYGLDYVVWWHIDLVGRDGIVHRATATRGKYGWMNPETYAPIPFTDKRGTVLRMRPRSG